MENEFLKEVVGLTVDHYVAVIAVEMGAHSLVHVVKAVMKAIRRLRQKGIVETLTGDDDPLHIGCLASLQRCS